MGQSYQICNLDKRETLSTDWFGQGNHLPDLARPGDGVMVGLAILLAASGTELYQGGPLYGRWAGDRVAIVGEYFEGRLGNIDYDEKLDLDIWEERGWIEIGEHVRSLLEREWHMTFPPEMWDDANPRSVLHEDGTLTLVRPPSERDTE